PSTACQPMASPDRVPLSGPRSSGSSDRAWFRGRSPTASDPRRSRAETSWSWSNLHGVGPRELRLAGGTCHGFGLVDNRRRAHPAPAGGAVMVTAVRGIVRPAPMGEIGSSGLALIGQDNWPVRRPNGPASQATRATDVHGARFHLIATRGDDLGMRRSPHGRLELVKPL